MKKSILFTVLFGALASGLYSQVVLIDLSTTSANETDLLNGLYYINVHTAANGGGEIRANLVVVPEPSSAAALLGLATLGFLAVRRR
jgi:hypothetical protein|tara:strand:+ start:1237 stop:1497 length:261 start_codon:yes stop_codon:yes gene_type:complete